MSVKKDNDVNNSEMIDFCLLIMYWVSQALFTLLGAGPPREGQEGQLP